LVALAPPIAAVVATLSAPDPHGHWTDHLRGAYLDATQLVVLVGLATWLTVRNRQPQQRWISVLLVVSLVVVATGIIFEFLGNYEVAQSIWRTSGHPGFGNGYDEGHERAELGDLLVVAGGGAFAVIVGVLRRVPRTIAAVALVMVVIPPPFVWPAAGVLLVLLVGLTSKHGLRERDRDATEARLGGKGLITAQRPIAETSRP
jgi:hypothetical protein